MKSSIILFSLIISAQSFASGKIPCKLEAELAIYERYTYEAPDAIISLSTKSYLAGNEATFVTIVTDIETGETTQMTAIMNANTCKVIAVN